MDADAPPPLAPATLHGWLTAALSPDPAARAEGERHLAAAEEGAAPGLVAGLLDVVGAVGAVDEPVRLLAAVLLKNVAGDSPRKALTSRDWPRVPAAERAAVRARLVPTLLADPSRRVAATLALAAANVARWEFPGEWPGLVHDLVTAAASGDAAAPAALLTLKRTFAALRGRRVLLDARALGPPGAGLDLRALARAAADERDALARAVGAAVAPLAAQWRAHLAAALDAAAPDAVACARGDLAARTLHALRGAVACLPDWRAAQAADACAALCTDVRAAAAALAAAGAAGSTPPTPRGPALAKNYERAVAVATAALERAPLDFAPEVAPCLPLYGGALLAGATAAGGGSTRPKARVALTRFLARALLTPQYRADWLAAAAAAARTPAARDKAAAAAAAAAPAVAALDALATGDGVRATLAALVEAYVALTPAEAAEWDADPEGFVLAADADASPDADAPRPCALALIACLVDRGGGAAAGALLDLAAAARDGGSGNGAAATTTRACLLREAAYRAVGECASQPDVAERLNPVAWWRGELGALVRGGGATPPTSDPAAALAARALAARAAWVAGVLAIRMPPSDFGDVLSSLVTLLPSPDLVVALSAAAALAAALGDAIDDADAACSSGGAAGDPDAAARAAAVAAAARPAVAGLVALLPRVADDESAVRVLGAASAVFELAGGAAAPALDDLAAALPSVWARAAAAAAGGGGGPGAAARLHSALVAVLTHVLTRLGPAAAAAPALAGVLWPLAAAVTDAAHPEADALRDDGLRLLRAALGAGGGVPPEAAALLPRAVALARRARGGGGGDRDRGAALALLEAAVRVGGCACLGAAARDAADVVAATIAGAVAAAAAADEEGGDAAAAPGGPPPPPPPPSAPPPLTRQSAAARAAARARKAADDIGAARDAAAALGVAAAMLQGGDAGAAAALEPALRAAAALLAPPPRAARAPLPVADAAAGVLARALAAAPAAFNALAPPGDADGARLADAWLRTAAAAPLEEVLGMPAAAAAGRFRRAAAAAALAAVVCAGPPPAFCDARRGARLLALLAAAADEAPAMADDVAELQAAAAEARDAPPPADPAAPPQPDAVFHARVAAAAADPLRRRDTAADFAAAAGVLAGRVGRDPLLRAAADVGGGALADRVAAALGGGGDGEMG